MSQVLSDIKEFEDVKCLVDSFYGRVQKDDLIGPIFNERIKDWPPHLEKMYSFWASILLGAGTYRGQPFPKHIPLPIGDQHFDRWLSLFEENIKLQFNGPIADEALSRAKTIGQIFVYKLNHIKAQHD